MNIIDSNSNSNRSRLLLRIISIAIGVGTLAFLAARTGIQDFLGLAGGINPVVLIPLVSVYTAAWVFRGLRLKRILQLMNVRIGVLRSACIELIADLPNQFIPARLGDTVKIVYLDRKGLLKYTDGVYAAFLVRIMDLAAVVLLTLVSSAFVSLSVSSQYIWYIAAVAAITAVITIGFLVFIFRTQFMAGLLRGPFQRFRDSAFRLAERIRSKPLDFFKILGVSMLVWIFDILTLLTFLIALDVRLSVAQTAFTMLLSTVAKILPLTPNGLGVYEGMMVVILTGFGIGESTAFTVAVLDHGFMNLHSMVLSLGAVFVLGIGFRGVKQLLRKEHQRGISPDSS